MGGCVFPEKALICTRPDLTLDSANSILLDDTVSGKPSFSIITVCRNEAPAIRSTCESIVAQTHADWEWIVIDGASTDGTLEVLKDFQSSITRLVSEPDHGIYDAMNKGLALAKGDYVAFMNGGDFFASNEALAWVAKAPAKDLIYGDLVFDTPNGEVTTYPDQLDPGYLLDHMMPHQATFYRRSLFDRFGHYNTDYSIAADYELYVRLLEVGKASHHHVPRPIAVFRLGGISNSSKHRQLKKRENHQIRMRYFPHYRWSLKALRQTIREFFSK